MVIGIDPSFTSTGVAIISDGGELLYHTRFASGYKVYDTIVNTQKGAESVLRHLAPILEQYPGCDVIVEYPALATRSGAYLAILHGYLANFLNRNCLCKSVTYVPPTACNSYTHNVSKTKSYLVKFCMEKFKCKRLQQDEATALILCHLWLAIQNKTYKNTSFLYTPDIV